MDNKKAACFRKLLNYPLINYQLSITPLSPPAQYQISVPVRPKNDWHPE